MKNIYNSILVPTDFGKRSLAALDASFSLAKMTGLEITLYHVIRDNQNLFSAFGSERSKSMKKEYEDQMRNQLLEIATEASRKSGTKVNAVISHGKAHDKILKGAHLLHSKFILQGINNEDPDTGKNHIGTHTLRVIKKSECPVIIVKNPHKDKGCRNILLPLDLTQETRQKVSHAVEMAKLFNSSIKVVSVYWSKGSNDILLKLQQQMDQVISFIKKEKIRCSGEILQKSGTSKTLAPLIVDYSNKDETIDMVMIMTQREAGLFDLFLGSSAQYIIRNTEAPVMTIIPKELGFSSMIN